LQEEKLKAVGPQAELAGFNIGQKRLDLFEILRRLVEVAHLDRASLGEFRLWTTDYNATKMLGRVRSSRFKEGQICPTPLTADSYGEVPFHVLHRETVFMKQCSGYSLTDLLLWGIWE
jgi:hypothetical protein